MSRDGENSGHQNDEALLPGRRIELDEIQNPPLIQALALWRQTAGARPYPARDEMPPRAMAGFLRNALLIRVLEGGQEFQFRVVGDAIVQAQGDSFQGLTMADIDSRRPGYGALLRSIYAKAMERGEPIAFRGEVRRAASERSFSQETVLLPLGPEGQPIDHLLVVCAFSNLDGLPPR